MECRNVTLPLDKAQEFYNSGNAALKEIALQAFTEDELKGKDFKKFKSWKDIEDDLADCGMNFCHKTRTMTKGQVALMKLNYIRRVLNRGQKMSLTKGEVWYPQIRFITKDNDIYDEEVERGCMVKVGTIKQDCGECYDILGGLAYTGSYAGLGYFSSCYGLGYSDASIGFLGCASKEIARHMSRYFAKEIFDAMYGDFINYEWI